MSMQNTPNKTTIHGVLSVFSARVRTRSLSTLLMTELVLQIPMTPKYNTPPQRALYTGRLGEIGTPKPFTTETVDARSRFQQIR